MSDDRDMNGSDQFIKEEDNYKTEQNGQPMNADSVQQFSEQITETLECPGSLVGKLIGRQGETISIIQSYSNSKVQVHHKEAGDPKKVSVTGTREQFEKARDIIDQVLYHDKNLSDEKRDIECPAELVGKVIGKAGDTIKALQIASGARIHVNQDFPEGQPRQINISGRLDYVEVAEKMIRELINSENITVQTVINKNAKMVKLTEKCPKSFVGKIIGKNGANIKEMNRKTRARIQIEQNSDPCIITISGPQKAAQQAQQELRDIIASLQPQGQYMAQPFNAYPQQGYAMQQQMPYMGQGMQNVNTYQQYYQNPQAMDQMGGMQGMAQSGNWQEVRDQASGRTYYYNRLTNQSQWEKPMDFV